jgi:hypothetical protein
MEVFPLHDGPLQREDVEPTYQAQEANFRVGSKRAQKLRYEPGDLEKHIVVPNQEQRRSGLSESTVVAPHLIDVVLVNPPKKPLPPGSFLAASEICGRPVRAAVLDDDELDRLFARKALPTVKATLEDFQIVERRNDD